MLNFTRNFVLSLLKLRFFNPKLRVFFPKFQNFIPKFWIFYPKLRDFKPIGRPTETSGVNSGIFCYRNFRSAKKHEVSNEVSVERKPPEILEVSGENE
jgi:hypothetical protein